MASADYFTLHHSEVYLLVLEVGLEAQHPEPTTRRRREAVSHTQVHEEGTEPVWCKFLLPPLFIDHLMIKYSKQVKDKLNKMYSKS